MCDIFIGDLSAGSIAAQWCRRLKLILPSTVLSELLKYFSIEKKCGVGQSFTYVEPLVSAGPYGEMSFRHYTRKLYDRSKASLLHLKVGIVKSKVVEVLLYGCAT